MFRNVKRYLMSNKFRRTQKKVFLACFYVRIVPSFLGECEEIKRSWGRTACFRTKFRSQNLTNWKLNWGLLNNISACFSSRAILEVKHTKPNNSNNLQCKITQIKIKLVEDFFFNFHNLHVFLIFTSWNVWFTRSGLRTPCSAPV